MELENTLKTLGVTYTDPRIVEVLTEAIEAQQYLGLSEEDVKNHLAGHHIEMLYAELPADITENRVELVLDKIRDAHASFPADGNGIFILFFNDDNAVTMEELDALQEFIDEELPENMGVLWSACERNKPELAVALVYTV